MGMLYHALLLNFYLEQFFLNQTQDEIQLDSSQKANMKRFHASYHGRPERVCSKFDTISSMDQVLLIIGTYVYQFSLCFVIQLWIAEIATSQNDSIIQGQLLCTGFQIQHSGGNIIVSSTVSFMQAGSIELRLAPPKLTDS